MRNQITPLILTYNEAPNIGRTLEKIRWAQEIVVVDGFSDDDTVEIVRVFPQARLCQRQFDSHSNQWNFGLKEAGIQSEWVLALDADYILTDELAEELQTLKPAADVAGYEATFVYCINGKRLRSGVYPRVTVVFRRERANFEQDGHTHRVAVDGRIENLKSPILHDDRKSLARWLESQSRYTKLEAHKLLTASVDDLGWTDRIRRWRVVAPAAMLVYCLIIRGGVLDGWAGFYYAFQRALAELMLSLYLLDHDLSSADLGLRSAGSKAGRVDGRNQELEAVQAASEPSLVNLGGSEPEIRHS